MTYEALLAALGRVDGTCEMHRLVEALNLALADREAFYRDPDFVDVRMQALLSPELATIRAAMIRDDTAFGRLPPPSFLPPGLAREEPGRAEQRNGPAGTHLDTSVVAVADADGNVFAATPSDSAADGPVVPGLGFVISTRGAQSFAERDHPACVAPGKRPRVTACPMLYEAADGRVIAGGGPGGDRQLQAMAQVMALHLAGRATLAEAVGAPRAFTQSAPLSSSPHQVFPGWVSAEHEMPDAEVEALARCGHRVARIAAKGVFNPSVCLVETGPAGARAIGDFRRPAGLRDASGSWAMQ